MDRPATMGPMAKAEVDTRDNEQQSRFEGWVGEVRAGIIVYALGEGSIELVHTEVDDGWEGAGVGSTMVRAVLDGVRREGGRQVVATCPFARGWIAQHPEYKDLLA